jgi:hypothetical protein
MVIVNVARFCHHLDNPLYFRTSQPHINTTLSPSKTASPTPPDRPPRRPHTPYSPQPSHGQFSSNWGTASPPVPWRIPAAASTGRGPHRTGWNCPTPAWALVTISMEICIAHDDNYLRKCKGTTLIRTIEVGGLDGFSRWWFWGR